MKSHVLFTALVSLICYVPPCAGEAPVVSQTKLKPLLKVRAEEGTYFYYRVDRYVLFAEKESFKKALASRVSVHDMPVDNRLLSDAKDWGNEKRNYDLIVLAMKYSSYLQRIELVLGDLIERGLVGVMDVFEEPGSDARFIGGITKQNMENDGYKGRRFCAPNGDVLMTITDAVYW